MAVREYIGARYVPVFADPIEWDSSLIYEPLTVVKHEGASYVSRKTVPEGIQINNTDYWILWADYNAQLQHYINEVNAFDGRIDALEEALPIAEFDDVNTVDARFDSLGALLPESSFDSVNTVDARIDSLGALLPESSFDSVNTIDARFDSLGALLPENDFDSVNTVKKYINDSMNLITFRDFVTGGNAVFIGDSYTYGTGASDHGSGDTKRWSSIVCSKLGLTEFNYAVGGTGFAKASTVNDNFNVQIQRAINGMTTAQKENTRLVFIAGGYNDAKTGVAASTLYSAAKVDCQTVYAAFPNALIVLIPMLWPGHTFTLEDYHRAIHIANGGLWCEKPIRVLKNAWTWLFPLNPSGISSDGIHPNDNGHFRIALQTIGGLIGNDTTADFRLVWQENTGFSATDSTFFIQNGRIHFEAGRITNTNAMSAGTTYNIGIAPNGAVPRYQQYFPIYGSNQVIGSLCIFTNGSMLVNLDSGKSVGAGNGFVIGTGANWLPYGIFS